MGQLNLALVIKMSKDLEKPDYLYKYCNLDRGLQILRDCTLFLCPPKDLNDLFEYSIMAHVEYNEERAKFLEHVRYVANGLDDDDAKQIVSDTDIKELKDNFQYFYDGLNKLNEDMREHSGTTCFSERFMDQRMWATYGDNHNGVCIQFSKACGESSVHKRALPVEYSNEKLEILPEILNRDGSLDIDRIGRVLCLRKTLDWQDEGEWRILMLASEEQTTNERLVHFEPRDIRRVFVGARVSVEQLDKIRNLVKKSGHDWTVIRLKPDSVNSFIGFEGVEQARCFADIEFMSNIGQAKDH